MYKVLESAVAIRLNQYPNVNHLLPCYQSAYRKKHSTETAMLRVWSDMLMAADSRQVTLLCLLDLSAAFDFVDHDLLLQRLQLSFSLTGVAFEWIRSFLTGRTQQIAYHHLQGQLSTCRPLLFGVSGIRAGTITVHSVHRRTLSRGRTARHPSASVRRRQPSVCQRRRQRHFDSNLEAVDLR